MIKDSKNIRNLTQQIGTERWTFTLRVLDKLNKSFSSFGLGISSNETYSLWLSMESSNNFD